MRMFDFIKRFSLPVSLLTGSALYLLFSRVSILMPVGDVAGPMLCDHVMPVILFVILYVTFCKIQIKEMMPRTWHFILQGIRTLLSAAMVGLIVITDNADLRLILEGVFICIICPTAAAAPVVTEKLGGSIASLTIYTIIANVVTSIIIPFFFPIVEKEADITFLSAMLMVLRNVTVVLIVPLVLALLSRKVIPSFTDWLKSKRDLAFYLWCINLAIVSGVTVRNILASTVSGTTLLWLLVLPLFVCIGLFAIGKSVGKPYGESISAGQALGQKNTVVGIWLTISFLNPLAAVAPGAYVLWQNMVNAWQLWYKEKYGKLKW